MEEIPNILEPNPPADSGQSTTGVGKKQVSAEQPPEPAGGRMLPLGQILADYSGPHSTRDSGASKIPVDLAQSGVPARVSLYRKAVFIGVLLGVISGCAALIAFLIISS